MTGTAGPALTFPGRPAVFYLATCLTCADGHSRPVPRIYEHQAARDRWAQGHEKATGHHVDIAVEIRPTPQEPQP